MIEPDYLQATLLALLILGGLLVRLRSSSPNEKRENRDSKRNGEQSSRSDEEVVYQLLTRHGGRLHQGEIVEATGWSKAKVSRLLAAMEDDGDIVKVPVGRENIVYLDGAAPEITKQRSGRHEK
jgi:uncharacterized membrane protein